MLKKFYDKAFTPEELENFLDEFEVVEPHEWGYCMIRKEDISKAQCIDRESLLPQKNKACFEKCGACIGSLRLNNHLDVIYRIGMQAQDSIASMEQNGIIYPKFTEVQRRTLKLCEAAVIDANKNFPHEAK